MDVPFPGLRRGGLHFALRLGLRGLRGGPSNRRAEETAAAAAVPGGELAVGNVTRKPWGLTWFNHVEQRKIWGYN